MYRRRGGKHLKRGAWLCFATLLSFSRICTIFWYYSTSLSLLLKFHRNRLAGRDGEDYAILHVCNILTKRGRSSLPGHIVVKYALVSFGCSMLMFIVNSEHVLLVMQCKDYLTRKNITRNAAGMIHGILLCIGPHSCIAF